MLQVILGNAPGHTRKCSRTAVYDLNWPVYSSTKRFLIDPSAHWRLGWSESLVSWLHTQSHKISDFSCERKGSVSSILGYIWISWSTVLWETLKNTLKTLLVNFFPADCSCHCLSCERLNTIKRLEAISFVSTNPTVPVTAVWPHGGFWSTQGSNVKANKTQTKRLQYNFSLWTLKLHLCL